MPIYAVREWVDVLYVQRRTREFAESVGFSKRECGELAIVASELTSNILKYGISGSIELGVITDPKGKGMTLIASDCGEPFHDLASALQDGCDDHGPIDPLQMLKRRGIGGGLGAVVRFTHAFWVESVPGGKKVHAVRYLQPKRPSRWPRKRLVR
jgi:anti-sigma regulatory factor (Ser/Thr protein kinase)